MNASFTAPRPIAPSTHVPSSSLCPCRFQIEPEKFVENNSPDGVGDLINSARVDWATGASSFPTVKATGAAIGIKIGTVTVLGVEPSEEAVDTPLGMLEKQALEKKLKMEMAVQSAIAKQEILLAGAYARSQNAVTTVSQIVNANVTAVSQLAGLAKGSGGSDRNYSRVFAACCCSVATKSSGGAWASLDASASSSLDINMLINSNMTATSTTRTEEKFSYAGPYESWTEFEEFRPL